MYFKREVIETTKEINIYDGVYCVNTVEKCIRRFDCTNCNSKLEVSTVNNDNIPKFCPICGIRLNLDSALEENC